MSYRWVEDGPELALELRAGNETGVFREAFEAFAELAAGEDEDGNGDAVTRKVSIDESPDHATLLCEWLSELGLLAREDLVPTELVALEVGEDFVTATVRARPGEAGAQVRHVDYDSVALRRERDGWHGTVVLDA
jgi:SHS2 domain-containing protein